MSKDIAEKIDEQRKDLRELDSSITIRYFNRFDEELINKFFNDEGKKAIRDYIDKQVNKLLEEAEVEARKEELLWVARLDPDSNWKEDIDTHLQSIKQKGQK